MIQRRYNGSILFNRTWTEYEDGFGDPQIDLWLGISIDLKTNYEIPDGTFEFRDSKYEIQYSRFNILINLSNQYSVDK